MTDVNSFLALSLNKWLKDKGVDFKIISDRNPSHKSIERIEL